MSDTGSLAEQLFECVPDAVIAVDPAGLIVRVNRQTEAMFGYLRQELLGKPVEVLIPERFRKEHVRHRQGFFSRPEIRPMGTGLHLYGVRRDGSEFPVDIMLGPIESREGAFVLCTIRDVTDRKRGEEALRESEERTRLLEAELTHLGRVYIVGEMASGLAHELSQPLSAVINYTQGCVRRLSAEPGCPPDILEVMRRAADQAERAGKIIQHLRKLVSRGQPSLTRVHLNDLVGEVLALVQPDVRRWGTTIQLELTDDLPAVLADPIQIQQVLLHLVRNGLEAMSDLDRGLRQLTIQTFPGDQDTLQLAVSDSGCGLSAEVLARLFTPFFTTKTQGMGMGLAISRTIIEAHGGQLWATSNRDRGARFQFTLPGNQADPADETDCLRRG